ncbi:uncharacterized protein VP01_2255g3 [Puccinia sorghi]|uniref:Uncharacterized protein n=1 Tax=Puccinia sorghi TaxID=27349 RepID=A0A0L6V8B5_9BASI|nr:uncharacterized protein VP01_2255g3 [Puccinia sorghi]
MVEETTNITTSTTTTTTPTLATDSAEDEPSTQITPSPISLNETFVEIITAGPSHLRIEEEPSIRQPNFTTATVSTSHATVPLQTATATTTIVQSINSPNTNLHNDNDATDPDQRNHQPTPDRTRIGIRKQIVLKCKLSQLRFKTKKFNQKFEDHEARKFKLKLKGNQCIFNMVEDGKTLLELNKSIIDLVFHLCLLRNPKR